MKKKTKAIPKGYHTITPYLSVKGASQLLEFLEQAFGATIGERMDMPGGKLMHAEAKIGDSTLMLGEAMPKCQPMPASLYVYVEDADAAYQRALKAGAESVMEPANQFWGDRMAAVKDACGNQWSLATHVEDVPPEELKKRGKEWMKQMK